jgi:hypothetical protein
MPIPPTGLPLDWIEAEASLPVGWRVSGLVREPDESWRAWALPGPRAGNPAAEPIEGRGLAPGLALKVLARNARAHGGGPMRDESPLGLAGKGDLKADAWPSTCMAGHGNQSRSQEGS